MTDSAAALPAGTSASARGAFSRLAGLSRGKPVARLGFVIFALILLVAIFAPLIAPHDPLKQSLGDNFKPPVWKEGGSWSYPLGADPLGRDLLSRLIYGARNSLLVSAGAVLLGGVLGFLIGVIAGYFGGWTDTALMRLGDVQLAFPFVLFAIAILAVSPERTVARLILVLGISSWIIYARVVRSRVLSEREKDYAWAARALGASRWRVLFRYIVPNVWQPVPLIGMLNLGYFVIVESLLSFLAMGLSPPAPSWGSMLTDGRQYMLIAPWMAIFPGIAIVLTVLSINLVADGLADRLDPKLATGHFERRPLPSRPPVEETTDNGPLMRVKGLTTLFPTKSATIHAVNRVTFNLERGKALGIVGESGSGKSTLGLSIIQLLDSPGRVTEGEILFEGRDLTRLSNKEMSSLRGSKIGMIFQDPGASLNPVLTVGRQLTETIRRHQSLPPGGAREAAVAALATVRIADPDRVLRAYPFQLSGGMAQRVMIALAMSSNPDLLILDEPTSALDVTTQAQLLDELAALRAARGTSILFITHDIALLGDFADVIMVMYAGRVCEIGPSQQIVDAPQHPYTRALIAAVERRSTSSGRLSSIRGDPPDPAQLPSGCPFADRCPHVMTICREQMPQSIEIGDHHEAACHLLHAGAQA
jgi:peptide/nickel transport system permease protein